MKKRLTILTALLLAANCVLPANAAETEILHAGFEDGISGWQARGTASIAVSSDTAAAGSASAAVTGRESAWAGISHALDSSVCPAGTRLKVQAQVMQRSGSAVHFKMTMQYQNSGSAVYDTFAEGDAASGEWLTLSAENYTVGQGSDPVLYFETESGKCDFWLDEVTVTKTGSAIVPSSKYKKGDADHSGTVDAADAAALCDFLLNKDSAVYADTTDLDGDSVLTAKDLTMLKRIAMNPVDPDEERHEYMSKIRDQVTANVPSSVLNGAGGTVEHITYFSKKAGHDKGANVWLPPGYDKNSQYPVLYVNHGYGGDEFAMMDGNGIREMATNLIRSGDAEPMIIVFTHQYTHPTRTTDSGNGSEDVPYYDAFAEDLPDSLMPYIESHYPAKTGRENAAVAGFSMGGRESLYIGMMCKEKIGYIGAAAPAPGIFPTRDQFMDHPGNMSEDEIRIDPPYQPYLLLIAGGTSDNMVGTYPKQYSDLFTEHGTENIYLSVPGGGHDSRTVTPLMYNFIRLIFKA